MVSGVSWTTIAYIAGIAGNLVLTPLLFSTLGAASFGLYLLVNSLVSYAGFFDLGITWAATKYFASDIASENPGNLACRCATLTRFIVAIGAVCVIVALLFGPALLRSTDAASAGTVSLVIAAVTFAISLLSQLYCALLRAAQRFVEAAIPLGIASVISPALTYAALRLKPTVDSVLLAGLLSNVAILLTFFVYTRGYRASKEGHSRKWETRFLREMLGYGGWTSISRVVITVMTQTDRVLVALTGSVAGLPFYAVPANLASRIGLLGGPLATHFFARASLLSATGKDESLREQHLRATRLLMWFTAAIAAPMIALGPDLLRWWINPEMAARGGLVLRLLAAAVFLSTLTTLDTVTLEAIGMAKHVALIRGSGAIAALLLGCVGVPRFGSLSIAAAVAFWYVFVSAGVAITFRFTPVGRGSRGTGVVGSLGLVAISCGAGRILAPGIRSLITALGAIGLLACVALIAGGWFVLKQSDREIVRAYFSKRIGGSGVREVGAAVEA